MSQWYYAVGQERQGPVDDATLAALAVNEIITPETLVWRQGMSDWQPYASIVLGSETEAPPSLREETPGSTSPEETSPNLPTGSYPPAGERNAAAAGASSEHRYAGFWIRGGAAIVDGLIGAVLTYAIAIPLAMFFDLIPHPAIRDLDQRIGGDFTMGLIALTVQTLYYTLTTGSRMQATLGKKMFGLRVIRADGRDISYGLAFFRYLAFMLSCLILYLGLIIAAFDAQKRALQDYICETRVIFR